MNLGWEVTKVQEVKSRKYKGFQKHLIMFQNPSIMIKEGFLYCSALNKKNAIKRFGKMFEHLYGKELIRSEKKSETQENS